MVLYLRTFSVLHFFRVAFWIHRSGYSRQIYVERSGSPCGQVVQYHWLKMECHHNSSKALAGRHHIPSKSTYV